MLCNTIVITSFLYINSVITLISKHSLILEMFCKWSMITFFLSCGDSICGVIFGFIQSVLQCTFLLAVVNVAKAVVAAHCHEFHFWVFHALSLMEEKNITINN